MQIIYIHPGIEKYVRDLGYSEDAVAKTIAEPSSQESVDFTQVPDRYRRQQGEVCSLRYFGSEVVCVTYNIVGGAYEICDFFCLPRKDLPDGDIPCSLARTVFYERFAPSILEWIPVPDLPRVLGRARGKALEYLLEFRAAKSKDVLKLPVIKAIKAPHLEPRSQREKKRGYADILEGYCDEFRDLIEKSPKEETIHQWLANPQHMIFFGTDAEMVWSKIKFGTSFVSDFIVKRDELPYLMIEIEDTSKLFNNDGKRSKRYKDAIDQVQDWMGWLARGNINTFKDDTPEMELFTSPHGLVVMGRQSNSNSKKDVRDRWEQDKSKANPQVLNYDEVISRVRKFASRLRKS